MSKSFIDHNALDTIQFYELIEHSQILKSYLKEGAFHFNEFEDLIKDVFHITYKYSIYIETPLDKHVNYEIIHNMLMQNTLTSLRKRTVGSKSNTYLAFKLILDRLFETIRGRDSLSDLQKSIKTLNELQNSLNHIKAIKKLIDLLALEDLFSTNEQLLLEKIVQMQLPNENPQIASKEWLKTLIDHLYDNKKEENDSLNQMIAETINKQTAQFEEGKSTSALETLLEENKSEEEPPVQTDLSEIIIEDDATSEEFEEKLKDEFEEKFAPYLKDQLLTEGHNMPQERQITSLDQNDSSDENIIRNGIASSNDTSIQERVHSISSSLENQLRNTSHFKRSHHVSKVDLNELSPLEDLYQMTEQTLQEQLRKLNLPRILSQAIEDVDVFVNTSKTLGIRQNSVNNMSFDEVIRLHKRYKNPAFVKFVNKVGKNKLYASKLQYKKKREHAIPIDKINSSHNIDLLIEEEYIALSLGIEAFENDFYDRYLRDDLLTVDMIRKQDKRKGSIILCYDGSGSMEGPKIEETQSHILAIMEIAKIQKRHLVLIQFASASEPLYIKEIDPTNLSAQDIMDVLDEFICGGTDFEKPLSKAIEYIEADIHKKSDILFITDGQCEIRNQFKERFMQLKLERDFKLYTIIMHAYTYHDYGDIGDISDEVLEIKGRDIGNWNDAINKKIYSLI